MRWLYTTLIIAFAAGATGSPAAAADGGSPAPLLGPDRLYDSGEVLQAQATPELELTPQVKPKSSKMAMLYSLLIPGLGEYYLGHKGRATAFFVVEGALWVTWGVNRSNGSHREDLYQEFAQVHAGVTGNQDDDYYRVIGNYTAADGPYSANEQVRREARAIYPNQPEKQEEYLQENGYFGQDSWRWADEELRYRYKDMRSASQDSYENANLTIGLLVANRILSVIDVGILSSKSNQQNEDQATLSWRFDAAHGGPGAQVILARNF